MSKWFSKLIIVTISIIITAIGASLAMKAAVGVGAWDALSQSVSRVIDIKVGTFSMILNISCVVVQLILLRKDFKVKHVLQIFVSILLGIVVNFMYYEVLSNISIDNYLISVGLFILSCIICAIGVSTALLINLVSFPLEACCMVVAEKINKKFGPIRQLVDIVSIVIAMGVALAFRDTITVREGTIIAMVIYGPMLDWIMRFISPRLRKLELID